MTIAKMEPKALLELLDAVYAVEEYASWTRRLVRAIAQAAGSPHVAAVLYDGRKRPGLKVGTALATHGASDLTSAILEQTTRMRESAPTEFREYKGAVERAFAGPAVFRQAAVAPSHFFEQSPLGQMLKAGRVNDQVILTTTDGDRAALFLSCVQVHDSAAAPGVSSLLTALSPHVSAAARLVRRAYRDEPPCEEATLGVDGRLQAAQGLARSPAKAAALKTSVQLNEYVRREAPDDALSLRVAMVAGRWSLIQRGQNDGRRYWVAVENCPATPRSPTRLTKRQRVVLHLVGRGATDAQIARELGIDPSTVATHIRNVARRLGVRGRVGLIDALIRPQLTLEDPDSLM